MRNATLILSVLLVGPGLGLSPLFGSEPAQKVWRVLKPGQRPDDARLGKLRTLQDAYHPWSPPQTRDEWDQERKRLREQVLVSNGLWPLPPRTPLKPVVHGKIDRGSYTVEKVFFAGYPGHYVTGNLYRPTHVEGKVPGILCPHGHWQNGRFYDAGEEKARQQIEKGAETTMSGARYPLQARMVQLAKMGCIVFHYDMVGRADSQQIPHREGFTDVEAGLRLQNFMGLQTWNSIRSLDFLLSLPEVDPERIGVTGASGGGTQTFMLCAVDPRPAAAFPAVMVSTGMQGGCVCENASYLRQGINNIAIAALFAPKPLAMSGADDWTIEIETKGLPELKQVYSLYGKPDLVRAKAWPQFKHNYNQHSRTMMYNWFNEHLKIGAKSPVVEEEFEPIPPKDLSVFDDDHPLPDDAKSADQLRAYLTDVAEQQFRELLPQKPADMAEYRRVIGTAARVMLDRGVPEKSRINATSATEPLGDDLRLMKGTLGRNEAGEEIPFVVLVPRPFNGTVVLWFDGRGKSHLFDEKGHPTDAVAKLLQAGVAVASADVFLTGEFLTSADAPAHPEVNETYQGYTFGYNRPMLSNRVRDVLTVVGAAVHHPDVDRVHLVGTGDAGPWVLLARALAGDSVDQTVVDLRGFGFHGVKSTSDPMFLPGALKYGGIGGLAALAAPAKLTVAGSKGVAEEELAPFKAVYKVTGGELSLDAEPLKNDEIVRQLLR